MLSASKGTRNQAGLINEVDVTRARTELANVEANLYATERQRAQVEHALAVLCGSRRPAWLWPPALQSSRHLLFPLGLPSSLLERRPDIVEAEQRLEGENARIGVAKAAFFPTIKLTSYLDVVDAQHTALQAGRQDAQLRGQRVGSTILLAKALGGWVGTRNGVILTAPARQSANARGTLSIAPAHPV